MVVVLCARPDFCFGGGVSGLFFIQVCDADASVSSESGSGICFCGFNFDKCVLSWVGHSIRHRTKVHFKRAADFKYISVFSDVWRCILFAFAAAVTRMLCCFLF